MLIDSNIIIYAAKPEHANLRRFIADKVPVVSAISYVKVLGFHKPSESERKQFEEFFASATVLPLSKEVLEQAVKLRQVKKMTLGFSCGGYCIGPRPYTGNPQYQGF